MYIIYNIKSIIIKVFNKHREKKKRKEKKTSQELLTMTYTRTAPTSVKEKPLPRMGSLAARLCHSVLLDSALAFFLTPHCYVGDLHKIIN